MKLAFIVAPLFVSSAALAQAPGDYYDGSDEASGAPGMAVPVAPVQPAPPPPNPRRWSIGLGIGGLNLAPHEGSYDGYATEYSIGQLAVRYRMTRHLELELAFAGGDETAEKESGYVAENQVSQAVLALRYRFSPHRKWNWWLMAGMGSLAITRQDASDEEREYANQSTLQFGLGLERRFNRFALQLEWRVVGVKANDEMVYADAPTSMPYDPYYGGSTNTGRGQSGGQVVLSGNYYF
jgi:hypothetical protein